LTLPDNFLRVVGLVSFNGIAASPRQASTHVNCALPFFYDRGICDARADGKTIPVFPSASVPGTTPAIPRLLLSGPVLHPGPLSIHASRLIVLALEINRRTS
jgi:hypothetical protein